MLRSLHLLKSSLNSADEASVVILALSESVVARLCATAAALLCSEDMSVKCEKRGRVCLASTDWQQRCSVKFYRSRHSSAGPEMTCPQSARGLVLTACPRINHWHFIFQCLAYFQDESQVFRSIAMPGEHFPSSSDNATLPSPECSPFFARLFCFGHVTKEDEKLFHVSRAEKTLENAKNYLINMKMHDWNFFQCRLTDR